MARLLNQLVGHRQTLQPLLDARARGRLASTLLFVGPSGVGKKLAAQALAQALVCERTNDKNPEACGECGSCLRMAKGQSESLLQIEPDGAAIKVEQARDILQFVSLQKLGRSRVIIVDQAHAMNPVAANALLKSLEEPPEGTYFILISPMAASVLPTIRSRSQTVRFRPLTADELKKVIGKDADEWVLASAQGSVETAQRLLESREEFQELETALMQFLSAAARQFPADEVSKLRDLLKDRGAQAYFASLLQSVFRDGLRLQAGLKPLANKQVRELSQLASAIEPRRLNELAETSLYIEHEMARNIDRGLLLENFALSWRQAVSG